MEKDKYRVLEIAERLFIASLRHEGGAQIGVADPDTCIDAAELFENARILYLKEEGEDND